MVYYHIEIRNWSRTIPMYLAKDWRTATFPECGSREGGLKATFLSREEAENEAMLFAAARPKYLGVLSVGRTGGFPGDMRYTVERHRQRPGYTIRDVQPRYQHGEDVEGYGWVAYNPPRRLPDTSGWYKRKRDAAARAEELNRADH